MPSKKTILLTIDVEDWFQVENFKPWIPFETWDQRELRVERNVHRLLDLFDSFNISPTEGQMADEEESIIEKTKDLGNFRRRRIGCSHFHPENENEQIKNLQNPVNPVKKNKKEIQATFFILGWIAERLPNLVREIQSRGHEIASHGYNHNLCNQQSHSDLKQELTDSKELLEDITGSHVFGFRAPNFSISDDILKIIEDCGYLYDSSYNSFGLHSRYGQISLNGNSRKGIAHKISESFYELPISNLILKSRTFPLGGGAYFRMLPFSFFRHGIQSILKKDGTYLFYIHPWELDPEQPRVEQSSFQLKFRHYTNIRRTSLKLSRLLNEFQQCRFTTCSQYLASKPPSFPA
jgi:polysaccharide deacetylase family protein (PEP-CTERM system associated)